MDENKLPNHNIKQLTPEIRSVLNKKGIKKFYPPQEKSIEFIIQKRNLIVSIPTASGKTLIAEIAIIQRLLEFRKKKIKKKAIYLCPLKALAVEKYNEFKSDWAELGFKISYAVGNPDEYNYKTFNNDIIILTNEKADSLLRNRPELIKDIGIVVVDEIHLLSDESRGVTLEILLTRLKTINPSIQFIGLSATIKNADELAIWLDGVLIKSEWRPVELREGYYIDNVIYFSNGETKFIEKLSKNSIFNLVSDTLKEKGQCLVFVNSRRESKSVAKKLASKLKGFYNQEDSLEILNMLTDFKKLVQSKEITKDIEILSETLPSGVSYHNSGLSQEIRGFIEDNFRRGGIKVIVSTPTLAAGVNTPARRVIIKSIYRYNPKVGGMVKIPINEYKQMSGRAGRPQYDPYGESIIVAPSSERGKKIALYYIFGEPEGIYSKLNNSELLEIHLLGNICMKKEISYSEILDFMKNSFIYSQMLYGTNKMNQSQNNSNFYSDIDELVNSFDKYNKEVRTRRRRKGAKGNDPLNLSNLDTTFISSYDLIAKEGNLKNKDDVYVMEFKPNPIKQEQQIINFLNKAVRDALEYLYQYDFIQKIKKEARNSTKTSSINNNPLFSPTKIGEITNKLYLKPRVAYGIIRRLKLLENIEVNPVKNKKFVIDEITILYIIALSKEIQGIEAKASEREIIDHYLSIFQKNLEMFTFLIDSEENIALETDLSALKQTFILYEWISEQREREITDRYNIGSGDLQRIIETAQWISRAVIEFASLLKSKKIINLTKDLNIRIKHGVKRELLPLVKLKGIGRVRARSLYKNGISSVEDLYNTPDEKLAKIPLFSKNIISSLKEQIKKDFDIKLQTANSGTSKISNNNAKNEKLTNKKKELLTKKKSTKKMTKRQTTLF
ncbi:MAG: DEAD/DEAH box helicase [Promethearchaeota archaeon]